MPEAATLKRAHKAKRTGRAPSTQAGEFVREEIHHVREGKHGARSAKQVIAIGLSKARRAGVKLPSPPAGARKSTKRTAKRRQKPSVKRSRASLRKLKREGRSAASSRALARQARASAGRRSAASRKAAARRAAKTKGPVRRRAAAKRAAGTRRRQTASRRRRAAV